MAVETIGAPAIDQDKLMVPGTTWSPCSTCLHDMGAPVGAAGHVRQALAPDGTWLIVEPLAGGTVQENPNPLGRAHYAFSNFLCVPNSLAQEVVLALGAQVGEARIRDAVEKNSGSWY